MFSLNMKNQKILINDILTYDDIVSESFYKDKIEEYLGSITASNERENALLEMVSLAVRDMFYTKLTDDADDDVVVESYEKYIKYMTDDYVGTIAGSAETPPHHNCLLEFFDYVIGDYINNTIMNKTQKINNHSESMAFRGLNADTSYDVMSSIYESDVYDFINILHECNLLSQEFVDYYTDNVTENFITASDKCIRIISGTGVNKEKDIPLTSSTVMEDLAFPNSDFLETTIESLTRLQDIEEISANDISNVKELIRELYESSYTKEDFGGDMVDNLYHKYFTCITCIIDNDDKLNTKTIIWACSTVSQAIEKLYNTYGCKFVSVMVELIYLTLIVEKVRLAEAGEPIDGLMYFIHRMRQILFDNSTADGTSVNGLKVDTVQGTKRDTMAMIAFLSTLNLVITTLKNDLDGTLNKRFQVGIPDESTKGSVPFYESSQRIASNDIINVLTESFEILSDGSIKVTIPKKTTYMEEYANNHRLLKENQKVKDYEAMRYNLVYHILLVESIEKKVMYNKKVDENSEQYAEAIKARSFAMNDITTYLPEVKKHLPDFDLNKFYNLVKAEKQTVKIDTIGTISGVKRILNYILLK